MSGRIKQKVVKATLGDKDVLDMFNGIVGNSKGVHDVGIAYPKYTRIANHAKRFITLLTALRDSAMLLRLFPAPQSHVVAYVAALSSQFAESFNAPDLDTYASGANTLESIANAYKNIPTEVVNQFGECFEACKKCNLVNTILVTCKNLTPHKSYIGDKNTLSDRFMMKSAGMTFCPLPDLPQVNFKQIYIDDRLTAADKEFVLVVLHKMYSIGHDLYEAVSAPDVDIEEFITLIMSSIGEVKKHIPRCDQAFAKISESVGLLRNNFGDYYRDYTSSGNSTIMMENFVIDVSKNSNSSPTVTAQFRRIITHYRKLASQQANDPKLQALFRQVDNNFQELASEEKKGSTDPAIDDLGELDGADGAADAAGEDSGQSTDSDEGPTTVTRPASATATKSKATATTTKSKTSTSSTSTTKKSASTTKLAATTVTATTVTATTVTATSAGAGTKTASTTTKVATVAATTTADAVKYAAKSAAVVASLATATTAAMPTPSAAAALKDGLADEFDNEDNQVEQ